MERYSAGWAPKSVLIVAGLLVSGCLFPKHTEVHHQTDSPLFANRAFSLDGSLYEEAGELIPAKSSRTITWYSEGFLRVRALTGVTVLYVPLQEELTDVSASNLELATDAIPLGPMLCMEGPSRSTFIVCDNSKPVELPATNMGISVTNATRIPLIVRTFEPVADLDEPLGNRGVLIPAETTYGIFATAVKEV